MVMLQQGTSAVNYKADLKDIKVYGLRNYQFKNIVSVFFQIIYYLKVKVIYNIWIYNLTKFCTYKLYFYNFEKTIINLFAKVMKTIFYTKSKLLTCAYEVSKIWENLIL